MYIRKSAVFTIDCLAMIAGSLFAAPFLLVLLAPFMSSL
jgi:hypothetical protein